MSVNPTESGATNPSYLRRAFVNAPCHWVKRVAAIAYSIFYYLATPLHDFYWGMVRLIESYLQLVFINAPCHLVKQIAAIAYSIFYYLTTPLRDFFWGAVRLIGWDGTKAEGDKGEGGDKAKKVSSTAVSLYNSTASEESDKSSDIKTLSEQEQDEAKKKPIEEWSLPEINKRLKELNERKDKKRLQKLTDDENREYNLLAAVYKTKGDDFVIEGEIFLEYMKNKNSEKKSEEQDVF